MRNNQNKNIILQISILMLIFLFCSSLLFGPLHYIFISHENNHDSKSTTLLSKSSYDCPICKFHFYSFYEVSSLFKELLSVTQNHKAIYSFTDHLNSISLMYKKGRAPLLKQPNH